MPFVYFLQAARNGPIKIGFSIDPQRRIATLQTDHYETLVVLGLVSSTQDKEQRLHRQLKAYRIRGEWYMPTPEVLAVVRRYCSLLQNTEPSWRYKIIKRSRNVKLYSIKLRHGEHGRVYESDYYGELPESPQPTRKETEEEKNTTQSILRRMATERAAKRKLKLSPVSPHPT